MIKFSKPEIGDIRYLVFMAYDGSWWIQKVKMTQAGKRNKWFAGRVIDNIDGTINPKRKNYTGQYYYWQFVDSESDAKKMLIYNIFDTRDVNLFYRGKPDLEDLT